MAPEAFLYIFTIVASIVVALLLAYFASQSAKPVDGLSGKKPADYAMPNGLPSGDLRKSLYNEISEVVGSRAQCHEITDAVSHVFRRELEKGINASTSQLSAKYEEKIREKSASEEVAWKKYNKTFAEKKNTEAVIRSITEGLVVVDAEGKVVMMNPAAEKLLGVSKTKKIGENILDNAKDEQLFSMAKGAPDKEIKEIELVSKSDETKKTLRASSAVIEDENGRTVGMVSVLNDITKQKELDRLKANFVANVSHELRTPLVAAEKTISLILDNTVGGISKQGEELLNIATRNLKRLKLLIDDLLDLTKLEAGKIDLKREPASIEKVIGETLDGLNAWAAERSVKLEKDVEKGLPQVNMDSGRIIQVITNLVGNSIKFTPKGGKIVISAALGEAGREINVCVADNGIGISREDIGRIFEKFYQASERAQSDIKGTGIGLTIVREMVTLHGGKIWVNSEKGKGAKFTFTLPL
ncbi:MAG: ATP-binding protein [Candidatus Omnitrophota bacterium]